MKNEKKFCKCCNSFFNEVILVKDKKYHFCSNCNSVFLDSEFYLTSENQKDRYLLHNNTLDTEAGFSFDTYTLQKELLENEVYYLTYSIKTVNGLEKSVQKRGVVKTRSIDSDLHEKAKLVCNLDEENGYVTISLENKGDISEK